MPNNKKNKPKDNDGSMPDYVINHLIENTVGGFLLFYFNQESGHPEQIMSFDSPAHALALQKHMGDWSEALHEVNLNSSVSNIENSIKESQSNNNDEDEDEGK